MKAQRVKKDEASNDLMRSYTNDATTSISHYEGRLN